MGIRCENGYCVAIGTILMKIMTEDLRDAIGEMEKTPYRHVFENPYRIDWQRRGNN